MLLQSFNEPGVEIEFNEYEHTYTETCSDRKLTPVTTYIKRAFREFDAEPIAAVCAKRWGMSADDILTMWDNNAKAASEFGTGLHRWMELYQKFGVRALPRMALPREIVESFPWRMDLSCHAEILVTSINRGICGQCDRLVERDGEFFVCDYKFNVGAEEERDYYASTVYPDLPPNKLSKYKVQLSVYAALLAESGIPVADEVISHVWNGRWRHHVNNRIKEVLDDLGSV